MRIIIKDLMVDNEFKIDRNDVKVLEVLAYEYICIEW